MASTIGNITGCHINPAVTVGLWIGRKIEAILVPFYIVGQAIGGIIGALAIWLIANGAPGNSTRHLKTYGERLG